jgi:hypothetical protein
MSAEAVARVAALDDTAFKYHSKAHFARAAEKYGAACDAAQALGFADCLITAHLQLDEATARHAHAASPGVPPAEAHAALQRTVALLRAATLAVRRRKAAGTLLPGACRPHEVAWYAARRCHRAAQLNAAALGAGLHPGSQCLTPGPLVGYDAYLNAAGGGLNILAELEVHDAGSAQAAQEVVDFAVSAVALVQQPRTHCSTQHTTLELMFTGTLAAIAAGQRPVPEAPGYSARSLLAAWAQLQRSGVLHERELEASFRVVQEQQAGIEAVLDQRHASAPLRTCALVSCGAREVHEAQFKKCAACQGAVYCCKAHQEAHWPAHKAACKAARKAAAEGGAGPSSGGA